MTVNALVDRNDKARRTVPTIVLALLVLVVALGALIATGLPRVYLRPAHRTGSATGLYHLVCGWLEFASLTGLAVHSLHRSTSLIGISPYTTYFTVDLRAAIASNDAIKTLLIVVFAPGAICTVCLSYTRKKATIHVLPNTTLCARRHILLLYFSVVSPSNTSLAADLRCALCLVCILAAFTYFAQDLVNLLIVTTLWTDFTVGFIVALGKVVVLPNDTALAHRCIGDISVVPFWTNKAIIKFVMLGFVLSLAQAVLCCAAIM